MSFLDRYEFEQILDEDLAVSRNQWQDETVNNLPRQLSLTPRFKVGIWKTILLGLIAGGLGLTLLHQPSFAQNPHSKGDDASASLSDRVALNIQQK